jgi:hypothetical protein
MIDKSLQKSLSVLKSTFCTTNEKRLEALKDQLKLYISQHANSVNVGRLTKEQYNEVVRLNINHANQDDLSSFLKHCLKYIFVMFRNYKVVDSGKFEFEFGKDSVFKTFSTFASPNERTMRPDGNVLVFGLVVLGFLAYLHSPFLISKEK